MTKFKKIFIIFFFAFFTLQNSTYSEIVNKISAEGNDRISLETIAIFGDIKIGDNYESSDINLLIKKLYETNFFSNITIELINGELKIIVKENPIINSVVFDGEKWPSLDETTFQVLQQGNALAVINKADLGLEGATHLGKGGKFLRISAKTGEGLDALLGALCKEVSNRYPSSEGPTITRHRHRVALIDCAEALQRFSSSPAVELAAEDLRLAIHSLGKITGRVHVEDVLDLIFKEFCIGK